MTGAGVDAFSRSGAPERAQGGLARRAIVLHHGEKIADGSLEVVLAGDRVVKHYVGTTLPPASS